MAVSSEEFVFHSWTITVTKSHILPSQCSTIEKCKSEDICDFCLYTKTLELPHLPEMVFPQNKLKIYHNSNFVLEFNALDALKQVIVGQMPIKVACSDDWKMSRKETGFTETHVHPFDWTFCTEYSGTLAGNYRIEETVKRIDIEKLKVQEKILFFKDIILFEDELHDNGIALCSVKFRIMPSGYFLLCRFFLRVDGVLIRIIDTRIHYEIENTFLLRERSLREAKFSEIQHATAFVSNDPTEYLHLIPTKYIINEKIILDD
ncbi:hypothetical protein PGB90_010354 [Kerria lacca]